MQKPSGDMGTTSPGRPFTGVGDHGLGWTLTDVPNKEAITISLSAEVERATLEFVAETSEQLCEDVTAAYPVGTAFLDIANAVREVLAHGRGCAVVSGLSPGKFSQTEMQRVFWLLGVHLGKPAIQNRNGERLAHVRRESGDLSVRGYKSDKELTFHSDAYEHMGLQCLSTPASGGSTRLVSALAIHQRLATQFPHLLPALEEGYFYAAIESGFNRDAVSAIKIPVFSSVGNTTSCMFLPKYMRNAASILGEELPHTLEEGIAAVKEIANHPDLCLEFELAPGEMLFCNNFTHLHARTAFSDEPGMRRHLLRMWLTPEARRPVHPGLWERAAAYERLQGTA